MKKTWKQWMGAVLAAAMAVAVVGCGMDLSDNGDNNTPALPSLWERMGVNYADTSITSLDLITSPEFTFPSVVTIYMRIEDQFGAPAVTNPVFNQYNFVVSHGNIQNRVDMRTVPPPEYITGVTDKMYAIAIDSSGSMDGYFMDSTKIAAKNFVASAVAGGALCAIIDFDDDSRLVQPLTMDLSLLNDAIDSLEAEGNTAIGNALVEAAQQIGARPGMGAVVILTDGENTSGQEPAEAIPELLRFGLPVYTIGLGVSGDELDPAYDAAIVEPLREVAVETGGLAYFAVDPGADLGPIFSTILAQPLTQRDAWVLRTPITVPFSWNRNLAVMTTLYYQNIYGLHTAQDSGFIVPSL